MSKQLSEEYQKAVLNDLPDLWDRIEAALPNIETEEKNDSSDEGCKVVTMPESNVKEKKKYGKNKTAVISVISALSIAALAFVVVVPVVAVNLFSVSDKSSNSAPASYMDFIANDAAACYEDSDEMQMYDSVECDSVFDAYEDESIDKGSGNHAFSDTNAGGQVKSTEEVFAEGSASEKQLPDMLVAENIHVMILEGCNQTYEDYREKVSVLCYDEAAAFDEFEGIGQNEVIEAYVFDGMLEVNSEIYVDLYLEDNADNRYYVIVIKE